MVWTVGRAIYLGGIEERIAHFHRIGKELGHLLLVGRRTVGVAHAHAAQYYGGDTESA